MIKKLILIGAGAFESSYNEILMTVRLNRLNPQERQEAERLIAIINQDSADNEQLERFGQLMSTADTFDYLPVEHESVQVDMSIYHPVWAEASKMRETHELINCADAITCPVVAFHGEYDSHPIAGVAIPLSQRLVDFKLIRLEKCGHTPWKERQAKDVFFTLLREELMSDYNS